MKCHSGAGHGPASERGAYGALCDACWVELLAWLWRRRGFRATPA